MTIRPVVIFAFISAAVGAQTPAVPDEVAYTILFQILRTAPPPHWEFQTKCNWLAPYGLSPEEVNELQNSANRFMQRIGPLDEKLKRHHEVFRQRLTSPEAQAGEAAIRQERAQALWTTVGELLGRLPIATRAKLNQKLEEIKSNTRRSEAFTSPRPHHAR
jgi:hypothetical protein